MTSRREKILQKLNPKLLNMTPKLSVENGSFINLDSDDSLTEGAKELKMRFCRNQDLCEKNKQRTSQNEVELMITTAKYNDGDEICEILSETLKLPGSKNEMDLSQKPGKNLQKLKMQLQEKMSAKWEEEYKKRIQKDKLNRCYKESKHKQRKHFDGKKFDKDFDSKNCFEENDEGSNEDDGCEGDDEDEEKDGDIMKSSATSFSQAEGEPGAKETSVDISGKRTEFEDVDGCSLPPAYQPGGGLLYGGSELTQYDEGLPQDLFSPSLKLTVPESPHSRSLNDFTPNKKESVSVDEPANSFFIRNKLFSQNLNDSFDLNDAYEFCSGKFPDEFSNSQLEPEKFDSANEGEVVGNYDAEGQDEDENEGEDEDEDEDEDEEEEEEEVEEMDDIKDGLSGTSDKSEDEGDCKARKGSKVRKNIITYEDSDDEEESNQPEIEKFHETSEILSDDEEEHNKSTRKRKNLQFSDEEDEDAEGEERERDDEEEEVEEKDEDKEGERDDEKEEMEERDEDRSVHYDSEENEIINPKEFFEKEAELSGSEWSVDEDERGLDDFDFEEGDADNLDNDQVRSQLEKIHLRRMLDEDAREVRLIQEILFEDGDLHSDGKGRDRKFKWKNLGKTFERNRETETKEEDEHSSDDEGAEEEEQQRKLRHEKELFLMEKKKNDDDDSDAEIIEDFQSIKVTSIKNSVRVLGLENSKTELEYTEIGKHVTLSKARGSFLTRNEEFLSKLAKVTSSISDNVLGPKHSKNFVFATRSPEKLNKPSACKRQVDDAEIRGKRYDKKFKILSPDVDAGPSILDLLA